MSIWKSLKSFLFKDEWKEDENSIYFHEDSFCQVEFLPRENIFNFKKSNSELNEFAKKHFDGFGYTNIYQRENKGVKIIDRKINFIEINNSLKDKGFKRIDKVHEGYGSTSWRCKNTFCYLFEDAKIFISEKNNLVLEFWIDGFRFFEDESIKGILKETLLLIGKQYNLVLNDWDLAVTVDLKKQDVIDKYLNEELDNG